MEEGGGSDMLVFLLWDPPTGRIPEGVEGEDEIGREACLEGASTCRGAQRKWTLSQQAPKAGSPGDF